MTTNTRQCGWLPVSNSSEGRFLDLKDGGDAPVARSFLCQIQTPEKRPRVGLNLEKVRFSAVAIYRSQKRRNLLG